MSTQPYPIKTVMLVDDALPLGLAVNAASISAAMVAHAHPELMGSDVAVKDFKLPGVVLAPLPVLACRSDRLATIWATVREDDDEIRGLPFTRLAQSCKTYEEYLDRIAAVTATELVLASLALVGPRKAVTRLTGDFALFPGNTRER